jgi:hypothetical protein
LRHARALDIDNRVSRRLAIDLFERTDRVDRRFNDSWRFRQSVIYQLRTCHADAISGQRTWRYDE